MAKKQTSNMDNYEQSLIRYRDLKSALETAMETAVEGNKIEIAKSLLETTLSDREIAKHTNLTVEQIEKLRNERKKN